MCNSLANKHPLNLLQLDDSKSSPLFQELHTSQWLGQDVYQLTGGPDMIKLQFAIFHALTNEMKLGVDVLTSLVVHRVLAQSDRGHVVHKHLDRRQLFPNQIAN